MRFHAVLAAKKIPKRSEAEAFFKLAEILAVLSGTAGIVAAMLFTASTDISDRVPLNWRNLDASQMGINEVQLNSYRVEFAEAEFNASVMGAFAVLFLTLSLTLGWFAISYWRKGKKQFT